MADIMGTGGNDVLLFTGTLSHLNLTLMNPYDGSTLLIDDDYVLSPFSYDGGDGTDTLLMTSVGDSLFYRVSSTVMFYNIERIIAGNGGDLIVLSDASLSLPDVNVDGGAGDDILWTNTGNDTINARAGNDIVNGGPGNDTINGNEDSDTLSGGDGNDILNGGSGTDIMHGDAGSDTLVFVLDAISGPNTSFQNMGSPGVGGTGETVSIAGTIVSYDYFDGGSGNDVLQLTAGSDAFSLWDAVSPHHPDATALRLSDIEEIRAGNGNDAINLTDSTHSYGDIRIYGEAGNDTLWASSGNDLLDGGDGNDRLDGGVGNDRLSGGDGNDILRGGPNGSVSGVFQSVTYDKEFSDDTVFPPLVERQQLQHMETLGVAQNDLSVAYDTTATLTFLSSVGASDNMTGAYTINADGTISAVHMAWDNLHALQSGAQYTFDVTAGTDIGFFLISNGYNTNHQAQNHYDFSQGTLEFVYDYNGPNERAATINDAGSHVSLVYNNGGSDVVLQGYIFHSSERGGSYSLNVDNRVHMVSGLQDVHDTGTLGIGFENLYNGGDNDFNDAVFNVNFASRTVQTLLIQDNDTLEGGAGNDTLYGGAGDDILNGGLGSDILYGEEGSDRFLFTSMAESGDTIKDFMAGAGGDIIDISALLQGYDPLASVITDFVRLNQTGGNTELQVNADGQGTDFSTVATLENVTGLNLGQLMAQGNLDVVA